MTDAEKLVVVKQMYGGSESDDILLVYLKLAERKVLNRAFPFNSTQNTVPTRYEKNQIEITVYLLNKIGSEGQTSHDENGIKRGYESASVPESMLDEIIPFVGVN